MYTHWPNRHFKNTIQQRLLAPQSFPDGRQSEAKLIWEDRLSKVFDFYKEQLASIYRQVRKKHRWGIRFTQQLSEDLVAKITTSHTAPRQIQRELISVCGQASRRYRDAADIIRLEKSS